MYQEVNLISKRNKVSRIIENDKNYISKTFMDINNLNNEVEILKLLEKHGCNVPKIIGGKGNTILLEDLGQTTFLDWYEIYEKEDSHDYYDMILKLSQWMARFYNVTLVYYKEQYILSDVNFRNFIVKDKEIYGIDFELSKAGNIESDIGKLAAFALTYSPAMTTWKINFTEKLINILSSELNVKREIIVEEQNKELLQINKRRYNL